MANRRFFVGGNWKMHTTQATARELAAAVRDANRDASRQCEVAVFPPFVYLQTVGEVLNDETIPVVALGAQNVWRENQGAFTGEISAAMLADLGVQYVLAGHSERRHVIGEDDGLVSAKVRAVLDTPGLQVVLCVGETLEQREVGRTEEVVLGQVRSGLSGVSRAEMDRVIVAYEPVWAIGTGKTASPEDAQAVHSAIRNTVASGYDEGIADSLRIIYGGSVKGSNAQALFSEPDIDGGLIGGASLDAREFEVIVRAAVAQGE